VLFSGREIAPLTRNTYEQWSQQYQQLPIFLSVPLRHWLVEPFHSMPLSQLVDHLLWINIWWGILNLLPIYPLDGGRIARELFTLRGDVRTGIVRSLQLSIAVAVGVGVYGLLQNSLFTLLMFGYLAYLNYQSIQAYQSYGAERSW
jgi:Zn-dependent protease